MFGIIGSVMETSRQQMDFVEARTCLHRSIRLARPWPNWSRAFDQAPLAAKAMLLRTDTATLDAEGMLHLYDTLADLFEQVVGRFPSLGGFLLSGGETAGRLLAGFGVRSLRMLGEVMPLVALSQDRRWPAARPVPGDQGRHRRHDLGDRRRARPALRRARRRSGNGITLAGNGITLAGNGITLEDGLAVGLISE